MAKAYNTEFGFKTLENVKHHVNHHELITVTKQKRITMSTFYGTIYTFNSGCYLYLTWHLVLPQNVMISILEVAMVAERNGISSGSCNWNQGDYI